MLKLGSTLDWLKLKLEFDLLKFWASYSRALEGLVKISINLQKSNVALIEI
jgi:hypothetical protein